MIILTQFLTLFTSQSLSFLLFLSTHLLGFTLIPVISPTFLTMCIALAQQDSAGPSIFPTTAVLDFTKGIADDTPLPLPLDPNADFEAKSCYYGLPSQPISVYYTAAPWKRSTGPDVQCVLKEARPICKHPITDRLSVEMQAEELLM